MSYRSKILIVEDNAIVAEDIKMRVERMGYQVTGILPFGEDVIASIENTLPDLILMDINLKGKLSGVEASGLVRERYEIPVIFVTSYTDEKTLTQATETNPFGYIVKPFKDVELKNSISIALHKSDVDKRIKESEQWFKTTLRSIGDGVITTDMKGLVTFMNPVAEGLTGWAFTEAEGKDIRTVFNIVNEFSGKIVENPINKVIKDGKKVGLANHTVLISRQGREIPIKDSGAPIVIDDDNQVGVVLVFQDVTESRKAELKVQESEKRFKNLFDLAPLPYQSLDENGFFLEVNKTWLNLLGYERNEVVGRSFADFLNPEWCDHFKENFPRFKSFGEVLGVEFEMRKKDGTYLPVRFDGRISKDDVGAFIQTHCVFKDISSELKLREDLASYQTTLRQNQKLEAMGTLAGGIAHDFNNILTVVIGLTEISLSQISKDTDLHDNLSGVKAAGERARELVKQILTFSRQGKEEMISLCLCKTSHEAIKMLRSTIPTNIEIVEEIKESTIVMSANETQLNQVILNLVTNSVHAISGNGLIEFGVEKVHSDEINMVEDVVSGEYAHLYVTDNGSGISSDNLDGIFDPYFTTKKPDEGSGLGLSVVHGIVKSHSGHIKVSSEIGKGTRFDVYFPVAYETVQDEEKTVSKINTTNKGSILVVDDEPNIVKICERNLEGAGFDVTAYTSSVDAMDAIQKHPETFDVIVTDMTMPKITGLELAEAIKKSRPDLPVIMCTGYNESLSNNKSQKKVIDLLMMKPVTGDDLVQAVQKVLNQ